MATVLLRHRSQRRVIWMRLQDPVLLARLRKRAGLTQRQVGERAGYSHTFIAALECGRKGTCKPETALAIAEVVGVPVDILFVTRLSTPVTRSTSTGRSAA